MLDDIEAEHPSGPLPLNRVLQAFVFPVVRLRQDPKSERPMFARLMARLLNEPDPMASTIVHDTFTTIFTRFTTAFARALPKLPPEEIYIRIHFAVGAMAFSIAGPHFFGDHMPQGTQNDIHHIMGSLVDFIEAGMQTPVAKTVPGDET